MKIALDYDDTLSTDDVQLLAKILIKQNHDVHIVTSRMSNERAGRPTWNNDLYFTAEILGISKDKVHFCNLMSKGKFFQDNSDFDLHLDDDFETVQEVNSLTDVKCFHYNKLNSGLIINQFFKFIEVNEN